MRRLSTVLPTVAVVLSMLGGCASDPLADQYRDGSGKNYISGDGAITEYPAEARGGPVQFAGETTSGDFSSDDVLGKVVVVNFWFAACAPCRVEAPILRDVHAERSEVEFIGINVRDSQQNAQSFEQKYGISYPSILDRQAGEVQLAFAGEVPPSAVPTTIILDQEGRVAARVLGAVDSTSTLNSLITAASIEDLRAE
ncbi:TlpA family protein disulfide reductase [Agromyces bauzanensis]